MRAVAGVLLAAWLVVGVTAAGQRHYFAQGITSCDVVGSAAATVAAGPLNYHGVNPRVSCPVPSS
jgi:hypothetical protein